MDRRELSWNGENTEERGVSDGELQKRVEGDWVQVVRGDRYPEALEGSREKKSV
jgi:hypothetical protein